MRIPPPAIYIVLFVMALTLHHFYPLPLARTSLIVPGVVIIAAAALVAGWAIRTFWNARTTIVPIRPSTALVTNGPFRFTRNPMYVALACAYLGGALAVNSLWPVICFPLVIVLLKSLVIRREESYMETVFGPAYTEYKSKVRRWL